MLGQPVDELALAEIKGAILAKLTLAIGKDAGMATRHDWYKAAALALRDRIVHRWLVTDKANYDAGRKRVYYLSLEFLIGRLFTDALNNMGLLPMFETALGDLGVALADLRKCEPDAALGNGGLGGLRRASWKAWRPWPSPPSATASAMILACSARSLPRAGSRNIPTNGGLRQPLGIPAAGSGLSRAFRRRHRTRDRCEGPRPRNLASGRNRSGRCLRHADRGLARPARQRVAAVVGALARPAQARRVQYRRLSGASAEEARAESICKFLYPNDESPAGRELRLRQEYFFVSASLQDLVQRHLASDGQLRGLASKAAVQLNDTHPSLAVTELMRILVDIHSFRWEEAWQITVATLSYTNHTLLPEALETWPIELFERLLPRHLDIIYRINVAHLALADARCPGDVEFRASVSLIDESSVAGSGWGSWRSSDRIASMASRRCIRN